MAFSPLLDELIKALRCLPGVGPKSAQRMAFHLLRQDQDGAHHLIQMLAKALQQIGQCTHCRTLSETPLCQFCQSPKRRKDILCVVESPSDVLAIEHSGHYQGQYFVLTGHLSPLDGIGPEEVGLHDLARRLQNEPFKELILALNPTVEGEATAYYIKDMIQNKEIIISRIAYGIPIGGALEYVDGGTIAKALSERSILQSFHEV